jgi:hypothetical protein
MTSTDAIRSGSSASKRANVPGPAVISSRSSGRGGASGLLGSDGGGLTSWQGQGAADGSLGQPESQGTPCRCEPVASNSCTDGEEQQRCCRAETDLEALHDPLPDLLAQVADRPAPLAAVLAVRELAVVADVVAIKDLVGPARRERAGGG